MDLFNIPNSQQDIKIFYTNGSWQTWSKPKKCQYIYIICIGGGAGGSGGIASSNNLSSGGSSGAITRGLFNSNLLPDTLYINVGSGGVGGQPGLQGSNGNKSYVSMLPSTITTNIILSSGNTAASNGGAGETALGLNGATFASLGTFISTIGKSYTGAGLVNPFNSNLLTESPPSGYFTSPTTSTSGFDIAATSISPLLSGGAAAIGTGDGGRGNDGITSFKPFYSLAGTGGGGSYAGFGGAGGNGGIGCGGAGGGGGFLGGGKGGNGGDGLVIIISF